MVAMSFVRMMQVPVHQVVDMIPVWNSRVTALRPVPVLCFVRGALVVRRAGRGMRIRDFQNMFVHVIAMRHCLVPTAFPVLMPMLMPVAGMGPASAGIGL